MEFNTNAIAHHTTNTRIIKNAHKRGHKRLMAAAHALRHLPGGEDEGEEEEAGEEQAGEGEEEEAGEGEEEEDA